MKPQNFCAKDKKRNIYEQDTKTYRQRKDVIKNGGDAGCAAGQNFVFGGKEKHRYRIKYAA